MATAKSTAKKNGRQYTYEEKIKTLKLLAENGYNYNLTAKLSGVSNGTLRNWEKSYPEILDKDVQASTLRKVNAVEGERKIGLINKHYKNAEEVCDMVANRIKELVPACKDIGTLLKIHEMYSPLSPRNIEALATMKEAGGGAETGTTTSVIMELANRAQKVSKQMNKTIDEAEVVE